MTYCFDIDGTLCTNTDGAYDSAAPYPDAIQEVNTLHLAGHTIILYTARGSTTGIDWRHTTEKQMRAWGVSYHSLVLGKPTADVYVDDKAVNVTDWRRGWGGQCNQDAPPASADGASGKERGARP